MTLKDAICPLCRSLPCICSRDHNLRCQGVRQLANWINRNSSNGTINLTDTEWDLMLTGLLPPERYQSCTFRKPTRQRQEVAYCDLNDKVCIGEANCNIYKEEQGLQEKEG